MSTRCFFGRADDYYVSTEQIGLWVYEP